MPNLNFSASFAIAGSADVTADFGALTRQGAGGVAVTGTAISSGDASGHWQISGGRISPSATGEAAITGSYSLVLDDGQTVDITVAADTYSARSVTEINAAITDIGTAGGKTIQVRGETITTNIDTLGSGESFTSQVILEGQDGAHFEGGLTLGMKNILYRDFEVSRPATPTGSENGNEDCVIALEGGDATTILDNLVIHGRDLDPLGNYTANDSYNNWSAIGSVYPYVSGITIRNCHIHDCVYGLRLPLGGSSGVYIQDNYIELTYTDLIQFSFIATGSQDSPIRVERNVMAGPIGRPYAGGLTYPDGTTQNAAEDPHVDVLQFVPSGNVPSGSRISDFVYRQNAFWIDRAAARGLLVQGLVSFDGLILENAVVCGNYFGTDSEHAIKLNVDGGIYNNNTLCRASTSGDFDLRGEESDIVFEVNGAAPVARRNIVERATNAGTISDEIVIGRQGETIAYGTVFDGSGYTAEPTGFADLVAQFSVKPGGPADLGGAYDAGCFGSGYGIFGTPRSGGADWSHDTGAET